MNKVLLVGYVAANPIVNTYGGEGKKIARFSVAVRNQYSKNKENNSTFIPCVAWNQTAVYAEDWIKKGDLVEIDGRINISSYTNKEGKPTTRTDVTIDNITRLSSRSAATTNASEAPSFETKKIVQQIATIEDFKDDTEEYQPIGEDSEINK